VEALQSFVEGWLWICAAVVASGGAIAAIVKFWQWAHRTSDSNAEHIDEMNKWLSSDKKRIEAIERRQDITDVQQRLQLKALMTLLSHEIDGNYTKQLGEVRDEINAYLIDK